MDHSNLFLTKTTYSLVRIEYGIAFLALLVLLVIHIGDVRIIPAIILFGYIDLIGYLPGAIAYRRSPDERIGRLYYVLYNIGHSFITGAVVAGLWSLIIGPEWALLMIPLHLTLDRSLFGNFPKAFSVSFEPKPHPAFERVRPELEVPMTKGGAEPRREGALASGGTG